MDGQRLDCKSDNKIFRDSKRIIYSQRIDDHNDESKEDEDLDNLAIYQKYATQIPIEHFYMLIDFLKHKKVKFMIAPYEADSQLTYLYKINEIDYIMTEDSDLIAYGCLNIIRRLKKDGSCSVLNVDRKVRLLPNTLKNFLGMSELDRVKCCVLAGCDYLKNLRGLGFGSLTRIINSGKDLEDSLKEHIRKHKIMAVKEAAQYIKKFNLAVTAFTEQVVYCPKCNQLVNLSAHNNKSKTRLILKILNDQYVGKPIPKISKFVRGEMDIKNPTKARKSTTIDFGRLLRFFEYKPNHETGRIGNLTNELVTFDNFDDNNNESDKRRAKYETLLRKRSAFNSTTQDNKLSETYTHTTKSSPNKSILSRSSISNCKSVKYNSL